MPPETCPAHGNLMENIGSIKANQEFMCREILEIKSILAQQGNARIKSDMNFSDFKLDMAESRIKTKIVWGGVGTAFIALISGLTQFLIKKFGG